METVGSTLDGITEKLKAQAVTAKKHAKWVSAGRNHVIKRLVNLEDHFDALIDLLPADAAKKMRQSWNIDMEELDVEAQAIDDMPR